MKPSAWGAEAAKPADQLSAAPGPEAAKPAGQQSQPLAPAAPGPEAAKPVHQQSPPADDQGKPVHQPAGPDDRGKPVHQQSGPVSATERSRPVSEQSLPQLGSPEKGKPVSKQSPQPLVPASIPGRGGPAGKELSSPAFCQFSDLQPQQGRFNVQVMGWAWPCTLLCGCCLKMGPHILRWGFACIIDLHTHAVWLRCKLHG